MAFRLPKVISQKFGFCLYKGKKKCDLCIGNYITLTLKEVVPKTSISLSVSSLGVNLYDLIFLECS